MVQLVREAAPDVLLTHASNDYMTDHNETSRLVFDASFMATLPRFETASPHHPRVTPLYFMETVSGLGFEPTEFVDISRLAARPRWRGHARQHPDLGALPRSAVRRLLRRGVRRLQRLAARHHAPPPALKARAMTHSP
jgi:LmbE family N-acetylglucosaminyl deacetylase